MRYDSPFSYFWNFMRRGATYGSAILNVANCAMLAFNIIAIQLFGIQNTLVNLITFMLVVGCALSVMFVVIGAWDYRRGTAALEHQLFWTINPVWIDTMKALDLHFQGKDDEARAYMQKWLDEAERLSREGKKQ